MLLQMTKIVSNATSIKLQNCKKIAQLCQREARKAAARSVKPSKEIHQRARKANKEMLFFWKRNEREEREMRKKAEKEAIEKLRIEEEMREARRQARKLNFLITQTELYSHFIGKKIGSKYRAIFLVGHESVYLHPLRVLLINQTLFFFLALSRTFSRGCRSR